MASQWRQQSGAFGFGNPFHETFGGAAPGLAGNPVALFEYCIDSARSDSTHTGLGLGLALVAVAAAATLLGSEPTVRLSESGELTVEMALKS